MIALHKIAVRAQVLNLPSNVGAFVRVKVNLDVNKKLEIFL